MGIRIAAAQAPSVAGDIAANLQTHLRFVAAARAEGVQLLVFPELSLCGYELPLLRQCALAPDDARLQALRAAAAGMTVIVGAPVIDAGAAQPCIASITLHADGATTVYRKQYLHGGEEVHAQPGPAGATAHPLHGQRYVEAICADTTHAAHAGAAALAGATLYVAGVLISEGGYATDAALLRGYAEQHQMGVLLANHAAPSGGYISAGKSAFWAPGGELIVQAEAAGNYLVIAGNDSGWQGRVVPVALA
ncbi:carbon-nitrogen hydrolase family protein [Duganella sp. sic0402]|uniref:carbon-nitrogen hydrolase family protein n=1 Tax=Duganella sp. sic0402 TaxID=2854786 RepID=UPI001E5AD75C|nr:carbon-nitrogen hydrolase family protein [Duganella sp. sic0402]